MYSYASLHITPETEVSARGHWNDRVGEVMSYVKVMHGRNDLTLHASPTDLRRLAAACIEAAEKGEALEAEQAA